MSETIDLLGIQGKSYDWMKPDEVALVIQGQSLIALKDGKQVEYEIKKPSMTIVKNLGKSKSVH